MRNTDPDVIDVEFRVTPKSPLESWKLQLPRKQDRIGYILAAISGAVVVVGVVSEHMVGGFIAGLVLAGLAAMLTERHKPLGLASLGMAVLLTISGCSREPVVLAPASFEQPNATVEASVREATKYRDPRAGFKPKPIAVGDTLELAEGEAR